MSKKQKTINAFKRNPLVREQIASDFVAPRCLLYKLSTDINIWICNSLSKNLFCPRSVLKLLLKHNQGFVAHSANYQLQGRNSMRAMLLMIIIITVYFVVRT